MWKETQNYPRLDNKILMIFLSDRKSSCIKISSVLASQEFVDHRQTVSRNLCEVCMKAYRPKEKASPYREDKKHAVEHGLSSTVTGLHRFGSK